MEFRTKTEENDTKEIVKSEYINWDYFKNSTILVTGATGMIGEQIVKSLLFANEEKDTNIKVVGLIRNKKKAQAKFQRNKNLKFIVQDITEPIRYRGKIDYIIHTANTTSSKAMTEKPVETINSIVDGTKNVLDFAKDKNIKSMVYLSSMEVYGIVPIDGKEPLKEEDYGYLNILKPRSSYPEGKRLAECLCAGYYNEYKLPVKIARLVQTIGASVDYNDNRVFAQFSRNICEKQDIVLKTDGDTTRNYCYITDAVSAIFTLLERGVSGENYNVANKAAKCSIKELAYKLSNKYPTSEVKFQLDDKLYPPSTKLVVDTTKLEILNWSANVGLEEMFNRLLEDFYSREIRVNFDNNYYTAKVKDTINIAMSADGKYAPMCATAMVSILKTVDDKSDIRFFILDGGIKNKDKQKIAKLKAIKDFSVEYIDVTKIDWSDFPLNRKHISVASYYRLALPKLLPKSVEKIIYLDCDLVVESNIREFWDYDINDFYVGAVEDVSGLREAKRLNLKDGNYFNAGVLLLNIKKLCTFDLFKKSKEYLNRNQAIIRLQDQDILNGVLEGDVKFLPLNWNVNTIIYSKEKERDLHKYSIEEEWYAKYFPKIVHYSDKYKPWQTQCMHPFKGEYFKYLFLTDFKKEKFNYIINRIFNPIFVIQTNFDVYQIKLFNIPIYYVEKGRIKNIYLFGIKIFTRVKKGKNA